MNKNYVIAVVVIVLVLAIIFMPKSKENTLLAPSNTPTPTQANTSSPSPSATSSPLSIPDAMEKVVVTYTSSGFNPKTVTVKKGQVVEFVNQSGKSMSVASDPHPTHTMYPEFDQYKTSYREQSSFLFIFSKVGTWKYHDHLQASHIGTVIVE